MKSFRTLFASLLFWATVNVALAQVPPQPSTGAILGGQISIAVSNTPSLNQLPASPIGSGILTVYNSGTVDAYVDLGTIASASASSSGTCTATAGPGPSCIVPKGTAVSFWANGQTYISAVVASGNTTLIVWQGNGSMEFSGGGGSGSSGGGSVTQGTVPWVDTVYGPTAIGSPNANPPVIFGGTATNSGTSNVVQATVKATGIYGTNGDTSLIIDCAPASNLCSGINAGTGAFGSATPTSGVAMGGTDGTNLREVVTDSSGHLIVAPTIVSGGCAGLSPTNTLTKSFSNAGSASNLLLVSGTAAQNIYVCALTINSVASAVNVALVEGTTTTNPCDTGTAGMDGGATAATGSQFAANQGKTSGNGVGIVAKTATTADNMCLLFSAGVQVDGVLTYVKQ